MQIWVPGPPMDPRERGEALRHRVARTGFARRRLPAAAEGRTGRGEGLWRRRRLAPRVAREGGDAR